MARPTPIRITQNDRAEYAKLAKNTKAKLARTSKNYGLDLSAEIPVPKLEDFSTRSEYNEWKQKASSFTNRSNLHYQFKKNDFGVVASKARIGKIERENKRAIKQATKIVKEAENKPFYSGGKEQGTVGQRMSYMAKPNAGGISVPKKFNFNDVRRQDRLDVIEKRNEIKADPIYYDKRMERMKANFIDMIGFAFNSDADALINLLQSIPPDDFYELYLQTDEFDFTYYPSPQTDFDGAVVDEGRMFDQLRQMESSAEKYWRGEINMDLKPFRNRKGG